MDSLLLLGCNQLASRQSLEKDRAVYTMPFGFRLDGAKKVEVDGGHAHKKTSDQKASAIRNIELFLHCADRVFHINR